jgi:hypothetical protein
VINTWPDALQGVGLKLKRAKKHLDELSWLVAQWVMAQLLDPQMLVHSFDPPTYTVELVAQPPPDTEDLGLIVGDFAHNARSALDHLVYAIADARGIATPGGHSAFLLRPTAPEFDAESRNRTSKAGREVRSPLDGLTKDDIEKIRAVQPFEPLSNATGGDGDALWTASLLTHPLDALTRIDNYDKHRLIHATALGCEHSKCEITASDVNDDVGEIVNAEWFDVTLAIGERALIFRATLPSAGPSPAISIVPSYGPRWTEWQLGLERLRSIHKVVIVVVQAFAPTV